VHNIKFIQKCLSNYEAGIIDECISPKETMYNQWYFDIGRGAIDVILAALMACKLQKVDKVLDVPCGHGRVLRHLVHLFPDAEFDACDLDTEGVEFCSSKFGSRPIYSVEELSDVNFESEYDIIWVGSLFTHTSEDVTMKWLAHLAKFLSPNGIIIATLHGRWSVHIHNRVTPYIAEDSWSIIYSDYSKRGYGYHDYEKRENHEFISGSYGISLSKPHATLRILEQIPGVRIYMYMERGWTETQDVVVFGRPSYDLPWPDMAEYDETKFQNNITSHSLGDLGRFVKNWSLLTRILKKLGLK